MENLYKLVAITIGRGKLHGNVGCLRQRQKADR